MDRRTGPEPGKAHGVSNQQAAEGGQRHDHEATAAAADQHGTGPHHREQREREPPQRIADRGGVVGRLVDHAGAGGVPVVEHERVGGDVPVVADDAPVHDVGSGGQGGGQSHGDRAIVGPHHASVDAQPAVVEHPQRAERRRGAFVERQADRHRHPGHDLAIGRRARLQQRMGAGRDGGDDHERGGQPEGGRRLAATER